MDMPQNLDVIHLVSEVSIPFHPRMNLRLPSSLRQNGSWCVTNVRVWRESFNLYDTSLFISVTLGRDDVLSDQPDRIEWFQGTFRVNNSGFFYEKKLSHGNTIVFEYDYSAQKVMFDHAGRLAIKGLFCQLMKTKDLSEEVLENIRTSAVFITKPCYMHNLSVVPLSAFWANSI